jgi:hypothetical protein
VEKTQTAGRLPWLAGAALAALILAAGPHGPRAAVADEPRALPPDLEPVPADAPGFVTARVAELWQSAGAKDFRQMLAKQETDFLKDMERHTGLRIEQLERVTLILPDLRSREGPAVIVTTSKPMDRAKTVAALLPKNEEKKHQGKSYYAPPEGKGRNALTFVNDRTFVFGPTAEVQAYLGRQGQKRADGPLAAALQLAAGKHAVVGGLNLAVTVKDMGKQLPPQGKPFAPLFQAQAGTVTVVADADTRVDFQLTFADEGQAKEGAKAAQAAMDMGREFIEKERQKMANDKERILANTKPPEFARWSFEKTDFLARATVEALKNGKVDQKGRQVQVALRAKVDGFTLMTPVAVSWFLLAPAEVPKPPVATPRPEKP